MQSPEIQDRFTAPWPFAAAVFVFTLALAEKGLNLVGLSIPFVSVFPRQLLEWTVVLLIFDIALAVRQIAEGPRGRRPASPPDSAVN